MSLALCSWMLTVVAVPDPVAVLAPLPRGAVQLRHSGPVSSLVFTPDGETLISGSGDGLVRLWDVASGKERRRLRGHRGRVLCLALSPDGKTLASGSDDSTIGLWAVADGRPLRLLKGSHGWVWVRALAFSPDGQWLASADDNPLA
jgi:WD40 repeat protein